MCVPLPNTFYHSENPFSNKALRSFPHYRETQKGQKSSKKLVEDFFRISSEMIEATDDQIRQSKELQKEAFKLPQPV